MCFTSFFQIKKGIMTSELKVYLNNVLIGRLYKSKSNSYLFMYHENYLNQKCCKEISVNLPLQIEPIESKSGLLHSFFDNLASEGWLGEKQANIISINTNDKFNLLAHFGNDLAGGVHIKNDDEADVAKLNIAFDIPINLTTNIYSVESKSTISGIQKKLFAIQTIQGEFKIVSKEDGLSTHIAKCSSYEYPELIELEYLSTLAFKRLLPDDIVCEMDIVYFNEINENVLLIKRFDRLITKKSTIIRKHFEEFNQLLNLCTSQKYDSSYDSMAKFMYKNKERCEQIQIVKLFKRILACFLIGNTDAHLKNFAMFHEDNGKLVLTPAYDLVASSSYERFREIALEINGIKNKEIQKLKPKHIVNFGMNQNGFNLDKIDILKIVKSFRINKNFLLNDIQNCKYGSNQLKKKLQDLIEKRWNGTFSGIEHYLQKKSAL